MYILLQEIGEKRDKICATDNKYKKEKRKTG